MHRTTETDSTTRRSFLRETAAVAGATAATGAVDASGTAAAQSGPDYGDWFGDTSNFDGTYDFTGKSEVTVQVGAQGNGGNLAFSPAAIRVDPGTTVVWEWTGKGSTHNVVADDGSFESDMYSAAGKTFSHEFGSEGTYKYFCQPHKMMGMKGAVVVGGSGGKDPSQLDAASSGSGGSGGTEESGASHGSEGFSLSFDLATLVTGIVIAFLSPLLFGVLLALKRPDDPDE